MTDHAELRRLAEEVIRIERSEDEPISAAWELFDSAANPKTVLALLDEIDRLRSRLEIDERTPHDGIACRDETIKVLDEKCDRLKAENEVLRGALQAVVDDPTWRSNDNTLWPKIIKAMDKGTKS
ncbi:ead/Ea22-like family protein [Pseudomonas aeruginosa]|uniref:ead/Ea22-like family protein n=1 Tax=Pseudomonas aeruginosa TaxID=287 RepID=UPI003CF874B9